MLKHQTTLAAQAPISGPAVGNLQNSDSNTQVASFGFTVRQFQYFISAFFMLNLLNSLLLLLSMPYPWNSKWERKRLRGDARQPACCRLQSQIYYVYFQFYVVPPYFFYLHLIYRLMCFIHRIWTCSQGEMSFQKTFSKGTHVCPQCDVWLCESCHTGIPQAPALMYRHAGMVTQIQSFTTGNVLTLHFRPQRLKPLFFC